MRTICYNAWCGKSNKTFHIAAGIGTRDLRHIRTIYTRLEFAANTDTRNRKNERISTRAWWTYGSKPVGIQ